MDKLKINEEEWEKLQNVLISMIPRYDEINSKMTFGRDKKWRKLIAKESFNKNIAMEVGSGIGTLAIALKAKNIICIDPSEEANKIAKIRIENLRKINKEFNERNYKFITSSAENIPLNDNYVDIAYCSFSFRDFKDKIKSMKEIYRVLKNPENGKEGGKLIILDLAKHENFYGKFIYSYIKHIAPKLTNSDAPKMLAETYKAFGTPHYYAKIMNDIGFKKTNIKFLNFHTIFILQAEK